jgi:hypothetical protein
MNAKIIELIIEEGDDSAGLDGIALVEQPAHEATFEYFKEQEETKNYVLSDEEVPHVIQMFQAYGEPQGQLEKDGWVLAEIKPFGREEFSSILADPNASSAQDTPDVRFRYKYVGPSDKKNRTFCAEMMSANRVFRIEDIDEMSNRSVNPVGPSGYSIFQYRGSYNCRHKWVQLIYRREGKIINKSSVRKGLIDEDGMPGPDTRTEATIKAGNTPPRTGFSSEGNPNVSALQPYVDQVTKEVEREPVLTSAEGNMNVLGYTTRFFQICPKAIELFQHLISMPMDEDVEGMVRSAAQIADNIFLIESEVMEKGITTPEQMTAAEVLVSDFKDLIQEIDEEVGMVHDTTFMDGHLNKIQSYLDFADLEDACWPGYEAIGTKELDGREVPNCVPESMALELMKQEFQSYNDYPESAKNNACKAIRWKEEHGDEVQGMTQVGWIRANQLCKGENISEETIARMSGFQRHKKNSEVAPEFKSTPWKDKGYVAWLGWGGTTGIEWAAKKLESIRGEMSFSVFNSDQRLVVGPAMIPDKMIIRRNEITGEIYYVYFTAETIKQLQQKFMKDKLLDATNIEHRRKYLRDVDVVESWIVEDPEKDKQRVFNMDYPKGTWMIIMKVNDDDAWKQVKDGKLKGFSVQGYFLEKAKFASQEKEVLEKIKSILNEVR